MPTPHNPTPAVPDVVPYPAITVNERGQELIAELRKFAAAYPAEVFTPGSNSPDAIRGTALRQIAAPLWLASANELEKLHAENRRLRDALNEVCNINEAALRELDSRDYASRLNQLDVVRSILDEKIPVCPLNEDAEWSLEQCRQAEAERDRYRSIVGNVVRWAAIIAAGEGNPTWCVVARVFTIDRDAARELCREFGVDADGGETTKP